MRTNKTDKLITEFGQLCLRLRTAADLLLKEEKFTECLQTLTTHNLSLMLLSHFLMEYITNEFLRLYIGLHLLNGRSRLILTYFDGWLRLFLTYRLTYQMYGQD